MAVGLGRGSRLGGNAVPGNRDSCVSLLNGAVGLERRLDHDSVFLIINFLSFAPGAPFQELLLAELLRAGGVSRAHGRLFRN